MSNPQTFYTYGGVDLSNIFQPLSLGTAYPTATNYKIPDGRDLNQIFAAGNNLGFNIGYKFNGQDLSQIFASKIYAITDLSGALVTYINNNGYTGLIFDTSVLPRIPGSGAAINATCNIQFNTNTTIYCLLVGGGAGGAAGLNANSAGGGGGGAGYIDCSFNSGLLNYNIQIGTAGAGRKVTNPTSNAGGSIGYTSSISGGSISLIAEGGAGGQGAGATSYAGGGGGDSSNNISIATGGGGGGGGGGAYSNTPRASNNPNPTSGALNTSYNLGNLGGTGQSVVANGVGGRGGNAYSNSIVPPFLSIGAIYYGNGGGGGAQSSGGSAGSTSGGAGSSSGTNGKNATSGLSGNNYYYGNGGGGGAQTPSGNNYGGDGSNGVVILWWQN
jgi:hypothetical protein